MRATIYILVVGLVLLALWLGLRPSATEPDCALQSESVDPDEIYARAELRWQAAVLIKPEYQLDGPEEFQLAPLLVGRADGSGPSAAQQYTFGALTRAAGGALQVDLSRPTIYHGESTAILRGREYRQLHYRWWYAPPAASLANSVQGFRMTLDGSGHPVIWEVLRRDAGRRLIFVATPLEDAAREEFGEPLPGRRYSIEADSKTAPDVIVPRVITSGPVPMGPFLYIEGPTHTVATLICRCMSSQFDDLAGDRQYELRPLSEVAELHDPESSGFDDEGDPGWLERCLRLPVAAF